MKKLSITNFTNKLVSIKKLFFKWTPIERSLRSLLRSWIVKLSIDNIFIERLGFSSLIHDSYLKESRNRLEECIFLHAVSNLVFQQNSINNHIPEIHKFIWLGKLFFINKLLDCKYFHWHFSLCCILFHYTSTFYDYSAIYFWEVDCKLIWTLHLVMI